jgi:hypothetical protein
MEPLASQMTFHAYVQISHNYRIPDAQRRMAVYRLYVQGIILSDGP